MKKMKRLLNLAAVAAVGVATMVGVAVSADTVTWSGATTITTDTTSSGGSYSSTTAGENAILATAGTSTLTNPTITKSGSPSDSDDKYDFYGVNAAVLAKDSANLTISGGTVTTNGSYASALFATGTGVLNVSGTTITTSKNNSGGVMVTKGGTLTGSNLTITTSGGSSAAIRSDQGGGTLTVSSSKAETSGNGSPAIYSTAKITVTGSELTSTTAEGIVVEGGNSVTISDTKLTATNNKLNGNSETYKAIFLYQSMSGDAKTGTGSFTATDSEIINNNGDVFFVTNNTAKIALSNTTITQNDSSGCFLRAQEGKWGTSGSNGGAVTLTLTNETIDAGCIYIGDTSSLTMTMTSSTFSGAINKANNSGTIKVTVKSGSTWNVTGTSYITSLSNSGTVSVSSGAKLYVGGELYDGDDSSDDEDDDDSSDDESETISTGVYTLTSKLSSSKRIDVNGASLAAGANVQLWDKNSTVAQQFYIESTSDGYYTVRNIGSGKYLDAYGGVARNGVNVDQWSKHSGKSEKWTFTENSDGSYTIASALNSKYVVDVTAAKTANGTNIELWEKNSGNNQKFTAASVSGYESDTSYDGNTYFIASALNSNYVLDVYGDSKKAGANVQVWGKKSSNYKNQLFTFSLNDDGKTYTIKNKNSGLALDVTADGVTRGTNVEQWTANGNVNQKWVVTTESDGTVSIRSLNGGLYLDLYGGYAKAGANIDLWNGHTSSNKAQYFKLVAAS